MGLLLFFGVVVAPAAHIGLGVPRYCTRDRLPLPSPLGHMRSAVATAVSSLIVLREAVNGKWVIGCPWAPSPLI